MDAIHGGIRASNSRGGEAEISIMPISLPPRMKTQPDLLFLEPLEVRIAPAAIVYQTGGAGHQLGEIDYTDVDSAAEDAVFINTEDNPNDPISAVVGPGAIGVADTFYVKLTTNSLLKVFNNTGFQPLISGDVAGNAGITGTLIAFFVDKNLDNEVQLNELTGIALGSNVKAIVSGSVDGDVLSNYNVAANKLGGTSEPLGQAHDLLRNAITDVVISGNVNGSVLSGGQINKLRVGGSVNQVLAGTAASGYAYDFNGTVADGGDTITVATPAAKAVGVSILNTTLGNLVDLHAGDGGPGGKGGGITNITVLADQDGFLLAAGNGGNGIATSVTGGIGGAVNNVIINGPDTGDLDTTPNALIHITAGAGGNNFAGSGGAGGAGGLLQNVYVGFEAVSGKTTPQRSATPLNDAVLVESGDGGAGKVGGAGGVLRTVSIFGSPTGAGNNLEVLGGTGGATNFASTSSKSGAGGAVTSVTVLNPGIDAASHDSLIVVDGGDGGSAAVGGSGGLGGAVSKVTATGYQVQIHGGDGANGQSIGGKGGAVTTISLTASADGVRAERVIVDAGHGGNASTGRGGIGGAISGITMVDTDFLSLVINEPGAGNGGNSFSGPGGAGGAVTNLDITEFDTGNAGTAVLRAGDGGNGGTAPAGGAGGAAGAMTTVKINGVQLDLTATGGAGGDALVKGAGGRGGAISSLSFFSQKQSGGAEVTATITAGSGGNGVGTGAGGVGGAIQTANVRLGQAQSVLVGGAPTAMVDGGDITAAGGLGGNSPSGVAGAGGAVLSSTFVTFAGAVSVTGQNAGTGGKAGAGGRVDSVAIEVGTAVTVKSGNGGGGGAGANINNVGYKRAEARLDLTGSLTAAAGAAPLGAVALTAGLGSGVGNLAGNGGAITGISGFVGLSGSTILTAGNGGAVPVKSANGGNVSDISLFGGGGAGVEVRIQAGDALAAASAKKGGLGGSVLNVGLGVNPYDVATPSDPDNVFALDPGTILRSIAAGNGGNTSLATGVGGKGGDVKNVNTHHDIGVRSGLGFGFATMGGLFAGSGGINTTVTHTATTLDKKDGAAGSVIQVTADAIAAIVAGRPNTGDIITVRNFVTKVDDVILNGLNNPTVVDANGTYVNFATANLIGGVVNPGAAGAPYPTAHPHANTFDLANGEFVDNDGNGAFSAGDSITAATDGFIAALSFINNLANVRPEALLTSIGGNLTFIDLNNTNGQTVQP